MVKVKTSKGTFNYLISERADKKLKVFVGGHWIHFGQKGYEHYYDKTELLDKKLNHNDKIRRKNYLTRAKGIKDGLGALTFNDINSPNYHSINVLW